MAMRPSNAPARFAGVDNAVGVEFPLAYSHCPKCTLLEASVASFLIDTIE